MRNNKQSKRLNRKAGPGGGDGIRCKKKRTLIYTKEIIRGIRESGAKRRVESARLSKKSLT